MSVALVVSFCLIVGVAAMGVAAAVVLVRLMLDRPEPEGR